MEILASPQVGSRFGTYQIEGILGEGGVAVVYRTRDENGQRIALKVLKPDAAQHETVRTGFEREYSLASRLAHPGVVGAMERGELDGRVYLTMPAVAGGSLDQRMPGGKRLPADTAIAIARQVALALHHVHASGIVHRDIKPANILLDDQDHAHLCDFGMAVDLNEAAVDAEGRLYGTPLYVAPEQTQPNARLDGRSDLYSLGVVLYRMVTGRAPFYGSRGDVLRAHQRTTPPRPSKFARISPALEAIILKALAKDPAERFQNGAEFATVLTDCELCAQPVRRFRFPRLFSWPAQMQAS